MAIWMVTSHTKGIASTQLAKDLKITQKSAWFVLHRPPARRPHEVLC